MVSGKLIMAMMRQNEADFSPIDRLAWRLGPALFHDEWNERVQAHNRWADEKKIVKQRFEARKKNERDRVEQVEENRRLRVIGDQIAGDENNLIDKMKSEVSDERKKNVSNILERNLMPVIKDAMQNDFTSVYIESGTLISLELMSREKLDSIDHDTLYEFSLSVGMQRLEYMLEEHGFQIGWTDDEDNDLWVNRGELIINNIKTPNAIIYLDIMWQ